MNTKLAQEKVFSTAELVQWLRLHAPTTADLRLDSREVLAGDIFIACPGRKTNGCEYINPVLLQKASIVLCEMPFDKSPFDFEKSHFERNDQNHLNRLDDVPSALVKEVKNLSQILGELADEWYGHPSKSLIVVAVTGTNGKTSCVHWIAQALTRQGQPCGSIGTLGAIFPNGLTINTHLTTPDVLSMHRLLAMMRDAGTRAVAIEASSIGIEQGRLQNVRVTIAALTNLTHDHLDYHGSMENYEQAKSRLFTDFNVSSAVINLDDEAGVRFMGLLSPTTTLGYSVGEKNLTHVCLYARDVKVNSQGQSFNLVLSEDQVLVKTPIIGLHNLYNLLLVASVLHQLGCSLAQIATELSKVQAVNGRLQTVTSLLSNPLLKEAKSKTHVVVDYAHTPDALRGALFALRPLAQARGGRLICLFGCGGERDASKRPEMGKIASQMADEVVVTSDNPRHEDSKTIILQIVQGIPTDLAPTVCIDRAQAIMQTLWAARPEDVVLLAGKGHETYQEFAGQKIPFDDSQWAQLAMLLPTVTGISTDTRRVQPGELFIALKGPFFNGHDYLKQAQSSGACAALVAQTVPIPSMPQIVVGDTGLALMNIAAAWRKRYDIPVVSVVGSNGKTTTKEMIAAIFADWLGIKNYLATMGNLNNQIGLPLTLLRLQSFHQAAVIEIGMNHPGEISELAQIAKANVAVMTNAQREHQEFMNTVSSVAQENGEAILALPSDGIVVYPGDELYTPMWDAMARPRKVLRFGLHTASQTGFEDLEVKNLEVYAEHIQSTAIGTHCDLVTPYGRTKWYVSIPGIHNLRNALAAAAGALAIGAPLTSVVRALSQFKAVAGRMQPHLLPNGGVLIDDTYNANPDSALAAIDVLVKLPLPRVLVLGDMTEVGKQGAEMHKEVGQYAQTQGVTMMLTLGSASMQASATFGQKGQAFKTAQEIIDVLQKMGRASILVKGSRSMHMERVVEALLNRVNDLAVQEKQHVA